MFNILLQVMDNGTLTDNNGRKADFRNVVLVMTTNAGVRETERKSIGLIRDNSTDAMENQRRSSPGSATVWTTLSGSITCLPVIHPGGGQVHRRAAGSA